jgi:putative ABC transport system permease protein
MSWLRFQNYRAFWQTAARIAWGDLRSTPFRAALLVITLASSITGVGGVSSAASAVRSAFLADARNWLAGDLAADLTDPMLDAEAAALNRRKAEGVEWTLMSTTLTTSSSSQSPDPAVVAVKAVDPVKYPFYGSVTISPAIGLDRALEANTVVVSKEVLERFELRVGDEIKIAGWPFRISAAILVEPDRLSGGLGLGMRCILSQEAYLRSGIALSANSAKYRVLVRVPPGSDIDRERQRLSELFPEGSVRDFRGAFEQQTETAISFLAVTAFLSLALGTIGAATAVRHHAEQFMPSLAIMRVLGARSAHIGAIFFLQIGWIAAAALVIGAALGYWTRMAILSLGANYLALPMARELDYGTLAGSVLAGLVTMAPILAYPALLIRNVRPVALLRADFENRKPNLRARTGGRERWLSCSIACIAWGGLAWRMLHSWNAALLLAGTLAIDTLLALALGALALSLAQRVKTRSSIMRLGIAGLYRPGHRSLTLITALATAFAVMAATFEAGGTVTQAVNSVLPYERDSLYVAGFKDSGRDKMRSFLVQQQGVERVEILTMVRLNLHKVAGKTIGLPHFAICEQGPGGPPNGPANLTMAEDVARKIHARVGSRFEFQTRDGSIPAVLAKIEKLSPADRLWSTLKLDCGNVAESSLFHYAAVLCRPGGSASVQREVLTAYPTLAVMTAEDLMETISSTSRDAMKLVRVVTYFAIGAGLCILIAAVSASQSARLQEIGVFSMIGARPRTVFSIYTVEFACIGFVAGVIAAFLAFGLTNVVKSIVVGSIDVAFDWRVTIAEIAASALLTAVAGWLPLFGFLRRRPIDSLSNIR